MNTASSTYGAFADLRSAFSVIIERRFLSVEENSWVVESACVSARPVANAKAQPAATSSVEITVEGEDGWTVVVRAAVCRGKLWQPERWLRLHDCADMNGRSNAEIVALFAEWVEAL